jgi:drug/metabolite transporter (DMT)-like permease
VVGGGVTVAQIAWARFFFNFLLLGPFTLWRYRRRALAPARPALQLLRGVLIVASNLCFVAGIRFVPLADAVALVFVAPLAVATLSPIVLGERVGRAGWVAIAVGFLGALVIVRPGFGNVQLASFLPLGAGLGFAGYLLITRKLAGSSPPLVTQATTSAVGAVLCTLTLPFAWLPLSPTELALMVVLGCGSCAGHVLITVAHEHAPAATLAPLTYLSLVSAAVLGFFAFGDWPDALTWLGAAVVVASGLSVWWRARREA